MVKNTATSTIFDAFSFNLKFQRPVFIKTGDKEYVISQSECTTIAGHFLSETISKQFKMIIFTTF